MKTIEINTDKLTLYKDLYSEYVDYLEKTIELSKFIEKFQNIENEYLKNNKGGKVYLEFSDISGENNWTLRVYGVREETDEEQAKRIRLEEERAIIKLKEHEERKKRYEENEKQEYLRLKKKFEGKT